MDNNTYEDPAVTSVLFLVFLGSGSVSPWDYLKMDFGPSYPGSTEVA